MGAHEKQRHCNARAFNSGDCRGALIFMQRSISKNVMPHINNLIETAPKRLVPIFILRFEICVSMVLKLTPRVRAISFEVKLRNKPRHTSCSVGVIEKLSPESLLVIESYCDLLTDTISSFVSPAPSFLLHISTKSELQEFTVFK
jgi:hypothetical protein